MGSGGRGSGAGSLLAADIITTDSMEQQQQQRQLFFPTPSPPPGSPLHSHDGQQQQFSSSPSTPNIEKIELGEERAASRLPPWSSETDRIPGRLFPAALALPALRMFPPAWVSGGDGPLRRPAAASRVSVFNCFTAAALFFTTIALAATVPVAFPPILPYFPTTILLTGSSSSTKPPGQAGDNIAYIFSPTSATSVDLLAINITSTLSASSLRPQTITAGVPFINNTSKTTSFTPSLLSDGTVAAYVGDCASSNGAPVLWTLGSSNGNNIWTYDGAPVAGNKYVDSKSLGPAFLGAGLSFSSQLEPTVSPTTLYYYGGMCPFQNATSSDWTRAAAYNNHMVKLGQTSATVFNISPVSSKGPPVAEAGFTLTPLTPSITNRSGIVTQHVNNVLLGGHTPAAFINMSGAAIWSLPQEAWSFVSIAQPGEQTNAELKAKQARPRALPARVDSRSGHTAVLSGDGTSLVILGGWVGDVSQAAEPQLAVLEMGAAFDQWKWTIPPDRAQPGGPGIFGHGAALLPGNVMMVYGGYSISSSPKLKSRQAGTDGMPMFLNLTSMTWADDYTTPAGSTTTAANQPQGGSVQLPRTTEVGVGVGLGLGIPLLIALIVAVYCWRKRRRNNRRRDSAVRALAQDANMFIHHHDEMTERRTGMPLASSWNSSQAYDWYTGGPDPFVRGTGNTRSLGYESLRGGSRGGGGGGPSGSNYSPPQRKPVPLRTSRGVYAPAPNGLESPRLSRGPGEMNMIPEADEETDGHSTNHRVTAVAAAVTAVRPESQDMETASDPFMTPVATNSPRLVPSTPPQRAEAGGSGQHREVQDWVSDANTTDAVLAARINTPVRLPAAAAAGPRSPIRKPLPLDHRRAAPTNDEDNNNGRTASNLSERSVFSYMLGRSGSTREPPTMTAAAATAATTTTTEDRQLASSSSSNSGQSSFSTARSNFAALQAEGPMLLAGSSNNNSPRSLNHRQQQVDTAYHSPLMPRDDESDNEYEEPGSPSKDKGVRRSWLGSLRRVFSNSGNGTGNGSESSRNESPSSFETGDYQSPGLVGASGMLLRRKQGREAWEGGQGSAMAAGEGSSSMGAAAAAGRSGGMGGGGSGGAAYNLDDDDDWDIERASERRLVQVMFTVPREPLRVVNAEIEKEEEGEIVDVQEEDLADAGHHNHNHNQNHRLLREQSSLGSTTVAGSSFSAPTATIGYRRSEASWGDDAADPFWEEEYNKYGKPGSRSLSPDMVRVPTPLNVVKGKPVVVAAAVRPTTPLSRRARDREDDDDVAHGGETSSLLAPLENTPQGRRSTDSRLSAESDANHHVIGTAEAVRLVRQRGPVATTRVLEMVERIEEEERVGGSRQGSPVRT